MASHDQQLHLITPPPRVGVAPSAAAHAPVAARLPAGVRFGTSSWSFPGWQDIVYAGHHNAADLARFGLAAYAQHPLLGCVGVDRTHYAPVSANALAAYCRDVPAAFRFIVKAHEACTLRRYPTHPRYGARAGAVNPLFLDAAYAADAVVGPYVDGLGDRAGALLFQFAPQDVASVGGAVGFARMLEGFLRALPRGPLYAVELRNAELLTPAYAAGLAAAEAVHCFNILRGMPGLRAQAQALRGVRFRTLVLRWMLQPRFTYEEAGTRYLPFDRIVDDDPEQRADVAWLVQKALAQDKQAYVIVNNNAEGCAPLSIATLAGLLASD